MINIVIQFYLYKVGQKQDHFQKFITDVCRGVAFHLCIFISSYSTNTPLPNASAQFYWELQGAFDHTEIFALNRKFAEHVLGSATLWQINNNLKQ